VPVVGQVYIYCYVFLFMYVVLMTIIAIVEEAFFSSSRDALRSSADDSDEAPRESDYEDMHPLVRSSFKKAKPRRFLVSSLLPRLWIFVCFLLL
jgi:hypothetical protein